MEYCTGSGASKQMTCSFLRPIHCLGSGNNVGVMMSHSQEPLPHYMSTSSSTSLASLVSISSLSGSLTSSVKASLDWAQLRHTFATVKSGSSCLATWHPSLPFTGHALRPRLLSCVSLDWRDH